ncbi:PEP-CTERM/exosortase A-associated glycosyltransferase [compost metagenome]
MNILLINHYAGSPRHGMEFRPYYLAREWIRQGHRVTIVASSVSHLRQQNPAVSQAVTREQIDGVDYLWLRTRPYAGNGAKRLLNMLQFTAKVRAMARELAAARPDVVIASSTYPYDIWPAAKIARAAGAKLVFEVHDLWPLTPRLLGGFSRRHPMIFSMQMAEDYACRHADKVVSLLPGTAPHLQGRGMAPGKFTYIPNGYDPAETSRPLPAAVAERIAAFAQPFKAVCVYAGGHAVSNALAPLVEAAARPESASTGYLLVGKGVEKPQLMQRAQALGLKNVLFLDPVEKQAVPALLALADIAYIGWHDSPLYQFGMSPNKLFDYMLAGLPVVHATNSPYDLVRDADCGVSVPADDVPAIAGAIAGLADLPKAQRAALGLRGQAFVRQHHSYAVLARQFLESLRDTPQGSTTIPVHQRF